MANYIVSGDINSTVLKDFDLTVFIEQANNHVTYITETYGLTSADIVSPIHSVLKEYCVAWCQRQICLSKIGANNLDVQVANDKYFILYQINNDEVERLRKYINAELIKQTASDPSEYSSSVTIYRG